MAKTIFISSFNPFSTRNILQTDVFKVLLRTPDLRLVIFCPDYKKEYFENNFKRENVIIEPVKVQEFNRQDIFFSYLGRSIINTSTLRIHRKEILLRNKNIFSYLFSLVLSLVGTFSLTKKAVRFFDFFTISLNKFPHFFDKYKPNLVFATDIYHVDDVHFLSEAKSRGIFTVGMVRSWDNITGKGLFRVRPDKLIVNNEVIKQEAIQYSDMKSENIFVGGMPQFDYYLNEKRNSREEFFKKVNLNPAKKTILFAPAGDRFYDGDWEIMEVLKQATNAGKLGNTQVLVRLPPNDKVSLGNFIPDKNFSIDRPGKQFQEGVFRDQEITREEMIHLADTLNYCDAILSYSSTICIDGAVFNKPIVTIGFDVNPRPYLKSSARFLDFVHVRKFLGTGCSKIAKSGGELIDYLKKYLEDPAIDRDGRQVLLENQVGKLNGKSGAKIAEFLINETGYTI